MLTVLFTGDILLYALLNTILKKIIFISLWK